MKLKIENIFQLAGVSTIVSGIIFILIQFIHPESNFTNIESAQWIFVHLLTFLFAIFTIFGITALYAKHSKFTKWLDLIGYIIFLVALIFIANFAFLETFILPTLYKEAPVYVNDVFRIISESYTGPGKLGLIYQLSGVMFLIGGIITGAGIIRNKIYSKTSGIVLIAGIVLTPLASVSISLGRASAAIIGLGLIYIGLEQLRK